MKMINWCLMYLILTQFSFSCCPGSGSKDLITIDVESNINNFKNVFLSHFTDDIHYVLLEKYEDLVFSGIWECSFSDSLILAKDINKCLLYDYKGNFISQIGNKGRGPGEYNYVNNAFVSIDANIYIQSLYDLFLYNINGEYLRKQKNFFLFDDNYVYSWNFFNDSLIFGHIPNSTGSKKYKAVILNTEGNPIKLYDNHIKFNRAKELASRQEGHANIYSFNGSYFYKEIYNDTMFCLTRNNQLIPYYIFNFGKFSEPVSFRGSKISEKDLGSSKEWSSYIYLENVFQSSKFLFLDCQFRGHFPAKRITPKILFGGVKSDYNTTNVLGIYDKKSGELVFCDPPNTDNFLYSSGICNDIDAGPKFYPMQMVNDSTFVMWFDANHLKEYVSSDEFKNINPKYPEKKKKLEKFANGLNEFDNPVLMFLTLRHTQYGV